MLNNFNEKTFTPLSDKGMFRKVFGDPNDTESIKFLLREILEEDIKKVEILNDERGFFGNIPVLKVIATLQNGERIGIDININNNDEE